MPFWELGCTLFLRQLQLNCSWEQTHYTAREEHPPVKQSVAHLHPCSETLPSAQNANRINPKVAKATDCHQDLRTFAQSQVIDLPSAASPAALLKHSGASTGMRHSSQPTAIPPFPLLPALLLPPAHGNGRLAPKQVPGGPNLQMKRAT